ncbi:MAG: hypothetical protein LBQ13_01000 [Endomicrobium sp.]|jgi:hypothetical protein|nr:hypothetical protein [Endomicrobium sp.]
MEQNKEDSVFTNSSTSTKVNGETESININRKDENDYVSFNLTNERNIKNETYSFPQKKRMYNIVV